MPEKILIVDDDLETLRLVGLMLQRQGYQVASAHNGIEALTMARNEQPDLIVLDIMMPDIDGYEVTRRLRLETATTVTPILMFTAKSQVDDKVKGYESGVDDYLTKPVHPAELVAHIKALLTRVKARTGPTPSLDRGYTLGVIGAKGGLGVSTLALNLALAFHERTKTGTIAAELRPSQGTWAIDLKLSNPEGLNNLLRCRPSDITSNVVEKELIRTTFGVRLLLASSRTRDTDQLNYGPQIEAIIQQLSLMAPFVILDIGTSFNPMLDRILPQLKELIVITEPQPSSVERTRFLIDDLTARGFGKSKLLTVMAINRVRADIVLSAAQMQEKLGQPIAMMIPPAPEQAFHAATRSIPLIEIQKEGLVSQQFFRIADLLAQRVTTQAE
ncbi:MAG TPA: response regulator [Longilinea sp.]|nr:response regulator [Longilinea sp.]